jgi:hypothetical protein
MTPAERERIIEGLLARLRAEADLHPRGEKAAVRRQEVRAIELCSHAWNTIGIPDDVKGRHIPERKPSRHMTRLMTPQHWVAK